MMRLRAARTRGGRGSSQGSLHSFGCPVFARISWMKRLNANSHQERTGAIPFAAATDTTDWQMGELDRVVGIVLA